MIVHSRLESRHLADNLLGDPSERDVYVYLPPGYEGSDRRYPTAYLLHALGDSAATMVTPATDGPRWVAPIEDVLVKGVRFMSGDIREPDAIDKQTAAVSQVSTAPVSQLSSADGTEARSVESLRSAAYTVGQSWQFDGSELSEVYTDWLRSQSEIEFADKQLTKTRELTEAGISYLQSIVDSQRPLLEKGSLPVKTFKQSESEHLKAQLRNERRAEV